MLETLLRSEDDKATCVPLICQIAPCCHLQTGNAIGEDARIWHASRCSPL
jgi:hypothetical protein